MTSPPRLRRPRPRWTGVAVGLVVSAAACANGAKPATLPSGGTGPATASQAGAGSPGGGSQLAAGLAYAQCMRRHGVPNFPDPVLTPSGGYGFRTVGIDPQSAAFTAATQACRSLAPQWWTGGQQLTPAQQQAWLRWASCIRSHGMPSFADPTFSGGSAVQISGAGGSSSPQLQAAMDACKSQMPSAGGLGG